MGVDIGIYVYLVYEHKERNSFFIRVPFIFVKISFGYHAYKNGVDLSLLQKIFNHTSPEITLRYIGIIQEDIDDVYININL